MQTNAEVVADGVSFDVAKLNVSPIREDQEYGGVRVAAVAHISSAMIRLQIDIGPSKRRDMFSVSGSRCCQACSVDSVMRSSFAASCTLRPWSAALCA